MNLSSVLSLEYHLQTIGLMLSIESIGQWDKENPWVNRGADGRFASNASGVNQAIQKFINNLGDQIQSQVDGLSIYLAKAQQKIAELFKNQPIIHDAILGDIKPLAESIPVLGEVQRLVSLSRVELDKLGQNKILIAIGDAIKASLPVAGAIALAVVPELAIGMLINESLITVAASLGIGQIASFAVHKGAERLDIKDKRVIALVDIITGLAANSVAKMGFFILRKTLKSRLISENLSISREFSQKQIIEKIRREFQNLKDNRHTGIREIFTVRPKASSITVDEAITRLKSHMQEGVTHSLRSIKDMEDSVGVFNSFYKLRKKARNLDESKEADYYQSEWLAHLISGSGLNILAPFGKKIPKDTVFLNKVLKSDTSSTRILRDSKGVIQAISTVEMRKNSLYVDLLTTSPWNYFKDHPDYVRGAGSSIIEGFVRESLKAGREGRVTLSAVPRARTFYEQIGFRYNSLAQKRQAIANDDLFEMTLEPEQALRFVQARTNIRNLMQKLDKPIQASGIPDEELVWMGNIAIAEESVSWQLGAEKIPPLHVIKDLI